MKKGIYILAIALAVLHQDAWLWDDRSILFGFMPVGLAYHFLFSLCSAIVWALAVKFAWPTKWEKWADEPTESDGTTHTP